MTRKRQINADRKNLWKSGFSASSVACCREIRFFRVIRGLLLLFLASLLASCTNNSKLLLENAENAWAAGDRASAITFFTDFLRRYPSDPLAWRAHYGLGNAYYLSTVPAERDLKKAEEQYRKILTDSPQAEVVPIVWRRVADIKAEQGERFEAIAEYENFLLHYPAFPDRRRIRLTIANLYHDMGNFSQAETEYQKVAAGSPYDEISESALLRISAINQMRDRYEQAVPALQTLAANSKDEDVIHQSKIGLSECLTKLARYTEAAAVLRSIDNPRPGERKIIKARLDSLAKEEHSKPRMREVDWRKHR